MINNLTGLDAGGAVPYAVTVDGSSIDTGGSTTTYAVNGTIPAGSLVVLCTGEQGGNRTATGVTDTKGNTWVVDQTSGITLPAGIAVASSFTTTTLTSADTIDATWTGSFTNGIGTVLYATHGQASSKDVGALNAGNSATESSGATAALINTTELVVGCAWEYANQSQTEDGNFTNAVATTNWNSGTHKTIMGYILLPPSTAGKTYAPTTAAAQNYAAAVTAYKLTAP
jgi:hypothetical protein